MLPLPIQTQAQITTAQPLPINNQTSQADPVWAVVGQYGVGLAALLAILKAYADYQLKAAVEDRAMKVKENAQSLELESRVFGSLLSQQESSAASTGQLLNTFIAKTLNQAEATNEQTGSLIATIGVLTEAIKFLGDTQQQQTAILYELKEYSESHTQELAVLRTLQESMVESIAININLTNQVLVIVEKLSEALAHTIVK